MARVFGLKTFSRTLTAANIAEPIITATQLNNGHDRFVGSLRVYAVSTNVNPMYLGDASVTAATSEPIAAGSGLEFSVQPKVESMPAEIDLTQVYFVGTTVGDSIIVTYIAKI